MVNTLSSSTPFHLLCDVVYGEILDLKAVLNFLLLIKQLESYLIRINIACDTVIAYKEFSLSRVSSAKRRMIDTKCNSTTRQVPVLEKKNDDPNFISRVPM